MRSERPNPIAPELVEQELARILSSSFFRRSERLCRFLRYSVQSTLRGETAQVKEYVVGSEVFERGASFDPRVDPVVRVEARRLRARLRDWYEQEGRNSRIVIELPTGRYFAVFRDRGGPADETTRRPGEQTIAVLPFTNLGGDAEGDYLSDGMTEELIHALTRLSGLRVVAWNTAAHLKGQEQELATVRQRLGVDTALRGSVRHTSGRLRITAQLIDTATGYYMWSEAWDRACTDVVAIEEEIAQAIANSLRVRLARPAAGERLTSPAGNVECHRLYLKGRFHWNKRTAEGVDFSIRCFEQAVAIDPEWPLGWCGLADAYAMSAEYGFTSPAESMPAARRAAQKALALNPSLGEACTSLAFIRSIFDWEWDEAEALYRRAIELNPGYALAHHWYGADFLLVAGRFEEAQAEIDIALRLDPLSTLIMQGRGFLYMVTARFDQALREQQEAIEFDPLNWRPWANIGRLQTQTGNYEKAIECYRKARSMIGNQPVLLGAMGQACALAGRTGEARGLLDDLDRMSASVFVPSTAPAFIHLGLGEHERALDCLERGLERRDIPVTRSLRVHPAYDPLRGEERFQMMLDRIWPQKYLPRAAVYGKR